MVERELPETATSWLNQRHDTGELVQNMHVLWGTPPEEASQSTQSSGTKNADGEQPAETGLRRAAGKAVRPGSSRAQHHERGAADDGSTLRSTGSWADSSETPRYVVPVAPPSQNSSGTHSSDSRFDEETGEHHIVFGDDDPSDTSDRAGDPRSSADSAYDGTASSSAPGRYVGRGTASVGSRLHDAGQCKPCMFSHSLIGCSSGAACEFCHLNHRRRRGPRPCKAKRDRFKAIVQRQAREAGLADADIGEVAEDQDSEELWEQAERKVVNSNHPYGKSKRILHL